MTTDLRALAREAVELAGKAEGFMQWGLTVDTPARDYYAHAGTHYGEIARALLVALDERDQAQANYQFMVDRAVNEKLDGYRELGAMAAAAENDRDAILADLSHVLGRCGCPSEGAWGRHGSHWPADHYAALERLEARVTRAD